MDSLIDLPAPPFKGSFVVLVEPEVVRIGEARCVQTRVASISAGTYRRVALLAWTKAPVYEFHRRFRSDQITPCRDFFRLSEPLLNFINDCRVSLGFSRVDLVQLWEFGGPIPSEVSSEGGGVEVTKLKVSEGEKSRLGRYYTHLRWHSTPKLKCEFCEGTKI